VTAATLRSRLTRVAVAAAVGAAALGLTACGGSDVTRARLERSLPQVFTGQYLQQAKILGHPGLTAASLDAKASCDKGGPKVADKGPGADWICLMTWKDPNIDPTLLPGKFELNVHSNDCYTAGGPSKLVGLITITDTHGNDVDNPVFEFDSCFDPKSSDKPTGVMIATTSTTATTPPATPAALTLPTGTVVRDATGRVGVTLICSTGDGGCAGTLTATRAGRVLGTTTYAVAAGRNTTVHVRLAGGRPVTGGALTLAAKPVIGAAPPAPTRVILKG
jgi:hypothetical protein